MSWTCPMCNSENSDALLKCYCGHELDIYREEREKEFKALSTNALVEIYNKRDVNKYDKQSFDLIESILIQRGAGDRVGETKTLLAEAIEKDRLEKWPEQTQLALRLVLCKLNS